MTGTIIWALGLGIGIFFGWFWGYEYGRKHSGIVVIEPLSEPPENIPEKQ